MFEVVSHMWSLPMVWRINGTCKKFVGSTFVYWGVVCRVLSHLRGVFQGTSHILSVVSLKKFQVSAPCYRMWLPLFLRRLDLVMPSIYLVLWEALCANRHKSTAPSHSPPSPWARLSTRSKWD